MDKKSHTPIKKTLKPKQKPLSFSLHRVIAATSLFEQVQPPSPYTFSFISSPSVLPFPLQLHRVSPPSCSPTASPNLLSSSSPTPQPRSTSCSPSVSSLSSMWPDNHTSSLSSSCPTSLLSTPSND